MKAGIVRDDYTASIDEDDVLLVTEEEEVLVPWQRALYVKQPYPDNYVDPIGFLESRSSITPLNVPISLTSLSPVVIGSSLIVQQLTIVAIFVGLYKYIINKVITFHGLLAFDVVALSVGSLVNYVLSEIQGADFKHGIQSLLTMGICLRIAAPILQTLTSSFSDDTIYALGIFFSATHVIFRDYNNMNEYDTEAKVGTLSLSAAMLTAILLASRLQKIETVFGFVLLAVICFSLFPITARAIYRRSISLHVIVLFGLWVLASALLYHLKELFPFFVAYEVLVVFVLFFGPVGLLTMQKYKKNMSGPWDLARL